jgi:hypothetical protein
MDAYNGGRPSGNKAEGVCNVTAYFNLRYEDQWIGRTGPVSWPPTSPDLTLINSWKNLMKITTYKTKT